MRKKRENKRPFADTDTASREKRRLKVAEMYAQGYVLHPIATLLGVSQQTISRDLEHVRKEWLANRLRSYDDHMSKQLAGLDMQESQLWEAWYRSCQREVITTVQHKKQLREQASEQTGKSRKRNKSVQQSEMVLVESNERTVTRQLIGDPRFMAEITRVRELRCKLLGLLDDEPITQPIVNIWQQLQEIRFNRDTDELEDAIAGVRQLPPVPTSDAGLRDVTGWRDDGKDSTDKHSADSQPLPSGFTDLDDSEVDKSVSPSQDTPLDD